MALDYAQYVSKLTVRPCPEMPKPPKTGDTDPAKWRAYGDDLVAYRDQFIDHVRSLRAWATDQATLLDQFRSDLITTYGLVGNPKAEALYALATTKSRMTFEDIEASVAALSPLVK